MIKYILAALVAGGVAGYLNSGFGSPLASVVVSDYLFNWSLVALLFVMGMAFGLDREAVAKFKRAGSKILVVPAAVAGGSLLGGLVSGWVLGLDVFASMAVCGGYGWYTLAGPLAGQILGAEWGARGLAVNLLRELVTIAAVSLLVRVDRYGPVAAGGATTMDTTLPVIVRYCGTDVLVAAFVSGFILSIAAPITIITITTLT